MSWQTKAAASRCKVRTATVDGAHPGMMKFCEDHVAELVGAFPHLFDKGGRWPSQETFVPVRLIPKAQGGLRPIAVFRSWFRLLAACQRERFLT